MTALEFDIGVARLSALDEGDFVGVQIDGLGDNPGLPPFELMHPYGFASRPADPDDNGRGCTALYATQGRDGFAWLCNDPRKQVLIPNLRAGETCMYGPLGQFVRHHDDGSITLCTNTDLPTDGYSIFLKLSPTNGLEFESPWGHLRFGPLGFHVLHSSGARIDLGSIAGIASPLDVLASYVTLSAGIASINATAVSQGTDGGLSNEIGLNTLLVLLAAMAAAIDSKTGPTTTTAALVAAAAIPGSPIKDIGKVV